MNLQEREDYLFAKRERELAIENNDLAEAQKWQAEMDRLEGKS